MITPLVSEVALVDFLKWRTTLQDAHLTHPQSVFWHVKNVRIFFSKFRDANGRLGNLKRSGDSDIFLLYTKIKGFQVIWGSLGHLGSNIEYGQRLKVVK